MGDTAVAIAHNTPPPSPAPPSKPTPNLPSPHSLHRKHSSPTTVSVLTTVRRNGKSQPPQLTAAISSTTLTATAASVSAASGGDAAITKAHNTPLPSLAPPSESIRIPPPPHSPHRQHSSPTPASVPTTVPQKRQSRSQQRTAENRNRSGEDMDVLFNTLKDHHLYRAFKSSDVRESLFRDDTFRNMCLDVRYKHPELIQDTSIEQSVLAFSSFMKSGQSMDKDNFHCKERNKLSNKGGLGSDDATDDDTPDAAGDAASDGAADAVAPLQFTAQPSENDEDNNPDGDSPKEGGG